MMDLEHVMIGAAVVIFAGASVSFILAFINSWVHRFDRISFEGFCARVKPRLLRAIQLQGEDEELLRRLKQGPVRHRTRLLAQIGRMMQGEERERITRIAHRCGVIDHARSCLGSRKWWRRLHGVRIFLAVGGGQYVVPRLLADPHPLVRSEAALWCGRNPDEENIRRLLNLMDTPTMADRIAVVDALVNIGQQAVGPMVKRLPDCNQQGRKAGLTAALGMGDPAFLPLALRFIHDEDPGVRTRTARLLSILGGGQAVAALEGLLQDPVPGVRAAAARGLGRLGAWRSAGALEWLLADTHPDPRRDAALALGDLGAAGWLILRETARLGGPAGRLADAVLEGVAWPQDPQWSPAVHGRMA